VNWYLTDRRDWQEWDVTSEERQRAYDQLVERDETYARTRTRETRFLVQDLIREGSVVVLASPPKRGKTSFATALAMAVTDGEPFIGRETQKGAVLWLAMEESDDEIAELRRCRPVPEEGRDLYTASWFPKIDTDLGRDAVQHLCLKHGVRLVVVDPLYGAVGEGTLADNQRCRAFVMGLKNIAYNVQATIVLIHHLTKAHATGNQAKAFADSTQLLAASGMTIHLTTRIESDNESRAVTLTCVGRGAWANRTILLHNPAPLVYEPESARPESLLTENERKIIETVVNEPKSITQISTQTAIPRPTARRLVLKLEQNCRLQIAYTLSGAKFYKAPFPPAGGEGLGREG
jgi:hypothetical protein